MSEFEKKKEHIINKMKEIGFDVIPNKDTTDKIRLRFGLENSRMIDANIYKVLKLMEQILSLDDGISIEIGVSKAGYGESIDISIKCYRIGGY